MINVNDKSMTDSLIDAGNSVCRVINPSINPAARNTGTKPVTILSPRLAPCKKAYLREYVPGNNQPLPKANPAAPAMTIADISNVP